MKLRDAIHSDMSMSSVETRSRKPLSIRPYARLLTMLGEQLLKNECMALVELIKNSYDADAGSVVIEFDGFADDMRTLPGSRIVVRDDGCGMSPEVVESDWMNPATPSKFIAKNQGRRRTNERNRVIQGEKGIGRFAVLKLARKITVTTRTEDAEKETVISYDFTQFDDDFLEQSGERKELFLDEVKIEWDERTPRSLVGQAHGTVIEMEALKSNWSEHLIESLCRDVAKLTDPVSRLTRKDAIDTFDIRVECNGRIQTISHIEEHALKTLVEDKPVLSIKGRFESEDCKFHFDSGTGDEEVSLYEDGIKGLWVWRRRYPSGEARKVAGNEQTYECGDFSFQFYIFDFARGIDGRFLLTQEEKNRLKNHRIYLYRDGVRVYPYGDPDDDWLNIDVSRGTGSAGQFFINDQVFGWIDITQEGNPRLRDKTNREGLIETGGASEDFVFLIRTFLSFIRQTAFQRYQAKQQRKNLAKSVREGVVAEHLANIREVLADAGEEGYARELSRISSEYQQERSFLLRRAEMTEDLAGVGLSVEMASHDIMLLVARAQDIALRLAESVKEGSPEEVRNQADMHIVVLQRIVEGMRDVQRLFRSSRRRRRVLKLEPILDRTFGIYSRLLEKLNITYSKSIVGTSPLVASTTDGVIMQVLINLFDNAAYWLDTRASTLPRDILVTLDGDKRELVFADNGPGIRTEDAPYIFEAFFSGKGQEGRGLGLYVARQLLERSGFALDLVEHTVDSQHGSIFVIRFFHRWGIVVTLRVRLIYFRL